MTISNSWSNFGLRQDQSLYRKLMRQEETRDASTVNAPITQITITVGTTSPAGPTRGMSGHIDFGGAGRIGMVAILNSAGIGEPPPGPSDEFSSNVSSLFEALESGDTDAAKAAADKVKTILDKFEAAGASSTTVTDAQAIEDTTTVAADDTVSETTTAATQSSEPDFITSLKTILSAVGSGDFDTAKTEASKLSETVAAMAPPHNHGHGRGHMIGNIMDQVSALLASVDSDDTTKASTLASNLRSALPDLDKSVKQADGKSFETDLAALLNSVESGDTEDAKSAAKTIEAALSRVAPQQGPPPPEETTASTSIETALTSLNDLTSTTSTSSSSGDVSAFLSSLKDLFEALKSGSNINQKLKSVISAYANDTASASASATTTPDSTAAEAV